MRVTKLTLHNFRNHTKKTFKFTDTTIIIGKNTAGKTNILEALYLLSHGKSFKAEKDIDTISEGFEFTRAEALIEDEADTKQLALIIASQNERLSKKFLVNNVSKRQVDFVSHFNAVLFTPQDLEIITDTPSVRRGYITSVLSQVSKEYRMAISVYEKALKQRNRMLYLSREGKKAYTPYDFEYWDSILIQNGGTVTRFREEFVNYVNSALKDIFPFEMVYDRSTITYERLQKYYDAERASATTLVGPQRDDFFFHFLENGKPISEFGSRGEQRLTIFQLKVIETKFLIEKTHHSPVLLLDDIFSELDTKNIHKVLEQLPKQQTIITTTHKEFVPVSITEKEEVETIEL